MTSPLSDAFAAYADRSSAFIATLDGFTSFEAPSGGWVRYVEVSGAWLGGAEPLAPVEDRPRAAREFADAARATGHRAAILPVTEGLAAALAADGWSTQVVGQEPVFELRALYADGADPLQLRPRVRGLLKKGVRVEVVDGAALARDAASRDAVAEVHTRWSAQLRSPPLSFLSRSAPLEGVEARMYAVVWQGEVPVAFVSAVPAPAANAWYFSDICRTPEAKPGVIELALFEAMRALHDRGAHEARLGMAALAGVDLNALDGATGRWARFAARFGRGLYDFRGNAEFKRRLQPTRWDALYLAAPGPLDSTLWAAVARAHLPGGLLHAASDRFVRRPLARHLRDDLRLEAWPLTTAELLRRTRVTRWVIALCLALHGARVSLAPVDALFRASAFTPSDPTLLGLFLGPLFHNHLYHLVGDLLSFAVFGGLLELLAGRGLFLASLAAGLWLSNPVTWLLVGGPMQTLWPEGYANFVAEIDYGSSNAIYAFVGGLSTCLRRPLLLLVPFFANGVWVCVAKASWLALHHQVALFAGWAAFRVGFVPRRRQRRPAG